MPEGKAMQVARARQHVMMATRQRKRLEQRAGRAMRQYDAVNQELAEAIEVFSVSDYANLSIEELAKAGGRIQRLATMLRCAQQSQAAGIVEATMRRRLEEVENEQH